MATRYPERGLRKVFIEGEGGKLSLRNEVKQYGYITIPTTSRIKEPGDRGLNG